MGTWVLDGALSVVMFLGLLPVAVAPLVARIYNRFGYGAPAPLTLALLSGLYVCALIAFTTFPLPTETAQYCTLRDDLSYWQLRPFAAVADIGAEVSEHGARALVGFTTLQVAFNVVFFVPLGLLLAYWARSRLVTATLVGLGVSLVIELSQGTALWGLYSCPYRVADVDDLIANTLGAVLGWLLGAWIGRRRPYVEPARRPDPGPPTVRRRLFAAVLDGTVLVVLTVLAEAIVNGSTLALGGNVDDVEPIRMVATLLVGVGLFLAVPLRRADRATVGQASVNITLARPGVPDRPAPLRAVLVRFVLRWLPLVAFAIWGAGWVVAIVVVVLESSTVLLRGDRRSLTEVLGGAAPSTVQATAASQIPSATG